MIQINITKAKEITHDKRRIARSEEFKPLDIKATIPSEAENAEAQRQVIREKYAVIQTNINNCTNADDLKAIYESI